MSHSGWSNDQLTELTIPQGATTGARITINENNDGAILVYNSAGRLTAAISSNGGTADDGTVYQPEIESIDPSSGGYIVEHGAALDFAIPLSTGTAATITLSPASLHSQSLTLTSGTSNSGTSGQATLQPTSAGQSGTLASVVIGQEISTGTTLTGVVIQNDDSFAQLNQPRFIHMGVYTQSTDGSGNIVLPHGALFTPKGGFLASIGGNVFYQYAWFSGSFNNISGRAHFNDNTGASILNTSLSMCGIFFT